MLLIAKRRSDPLMAWDDTWGSILGLFSSARSVFSLAYERGEVSIPFGPQAGSWNLANTSEDGEAIVMRSSSLLYLFNQRPPLPMMSV